MEFKRSLPSDVAMVSPFVDQVMQSIQGLRVTDGSELDIEIALREALLNAVIHGNREDPNKHVHLRVRCSADGEKSGSQFRMRVRVSTADAYPIPLPQSS